MTFLDRWNLSIFGFRGFEIVKCSVRQHRISHSFPPLFWERFRKGDLNREEPSGKLCYQSCASFCSIHIMWRKGNNVFTSRPTISQLYARWSTVLFRSKMFIAFFVTLKSWNVRSGSFACCCRKIGQVPGYCNQPLCIQIKMCFDKKWEYLVPLYAYAFILI